MPTKKNTIFSAPQSVVYFVCELKTVRGWYADLLGILPYRNDKDFVGFHIDGCNLCFHRADVKSKTKGASQVAYWQVRDMTKAMRLLRSKGATVYRRAITIPEGGRVMQMKDPFGNIIGLKR